MHFTHRVSCCCRACRILSAVKVLVASPELQVNVLHQEVQQVIRRCEVDSRLQLFNGGFDYCFVVRLVRLELSLHPALHFLLLVVVAVVQRGTQ